MMGLQSLALHNSDKPRQWANKVILPFLCLVTQLTLCCGVADPHKSRPCGKRIPQSPAVLFTSLKPKQGQSRECARRACVISVPAAPTLPAHAGRHQGHTRTENKTVVAFRLPLVAGHMSSL